MLKKVLAITLAVIMIICVLSVTAFAEGEGGEPETTVTEIYTIEDLYMINYDLGGNFKLMNDIDMTEATAEGGDWDYVGNGWEPIGSNGIYSGNTPFTGTFDGNGHKITGMRINISSLPSGTDTVYAGLFANNTGTIKNLSMFGSITTSVSTDYVGAIAGYNSGTIDNCSNQIPIVSQYTTYTGGIAGYNGKDALITKCSNSADIYGEKYYIDMFTGGISGCSEGTVSECYNNGTITSKGTGYYYIQYTGTSYSYYPNASGVTSGGIIKDCYNTGDISATTEETPYMNIGGISAGSGTVSNCYNTGTAEKAISYGTVTNCYFLSGSGADTTGAKSLTAAQMKLKALYVGFDFDNVWFIDNTADYPYPQLRSLAQEPAEDPTEAPTDAPTDTPTEAPTQAPVIIILGDVDGDLDASVIDASYIQRYNAGFNTPFAIGEPIELG